LFPSPTSVALSYYNSQHFSIQSQFCTWNSTSSSDTSLSLYDSQVYITAGSNSANTTVTITLGLFPGSWDSTVKPLVPLCTKSFDATNFGVPDWAIFGSDNNTIISDYKQYNPPSTSPAGGGFSRIQRILVTVGLVSLGVLILVVIVLFVWRFVFKRKDDESRQHLLPQPKGTLTTDLLFVVFCNVFCKFVCTLQFLFKQ
jgi:hypothetical protein